MSRLRRVSLCPSVVLAVVVGVWVLLSVSVAVATPAWEANDEVDHVRNVQTLVDGRWYRIEPGAGFEAHQPPVYYLLLAGWQQIVGLPPLAKVAPPLRDAAEGGTRGNINHDNAGDGRDQRHVGTLRLPGILLGALTLLVTAAAARRLSTDRWTPVVAAAWIAAVPKFAFLAGVVNNDNLTITLGAAGLLLAAIAVGGTTGPPARWPWLAAGLGAVAGLSIVTKLTAAWLAPGLLLAAVLAAPTTLRSRLAAVAAFGAAMLATCGWWMVLNTDRYGSPLAADATHDHLNALFPPIFRTGSFWHQTTDVAPRVLYETFWYVSGYNQFHWKPHVYLPFWLALLTAVAGLALLWRPRPATGRMLAVLGTIVAGALVALWITAIETTAAQARTVFFALPALATLAALGLERMGLAVAMRFVFPVLAAGATVVAIRRDIFDIYLT